MNKLYQCSVTTISSIRKLLNHVVRDAFFVRHGFRCPQHLQRIRDLSVLPHILGTNRCWMDIGFNEVAALFNLEENDFEVCLRQPSLVDQWEGMQRIEHPVGQILLNHRIQNNGTLPTRMRSLLEPQ